MKHHRGTAPESTYEYAVVFTIIFTVVALPLIFSSVSLAQVPPITPSGLNTQVSAPNNLPSGKVQHDITGGTRPGGGTNLFHSFGNFNVPNNNIANFLNDSGLPTTNILGRVTGGNISSIFGTIQTTGFGNANLFMMNPAGFLFGPNATVNVGGMVSFSSADYLRLADGKLFNAIPNEAADALLSTAPVAAYGFLGSNPGAITVQGSQLSVTPRQSISLVGGNITIQSGTLDNGTVQPARISAPNGQINLASTASPGEFLWPALQTGGIQQLPTPFGTANVFISTSLTGPNTNGASFTSLGTVHLSPSSTVDTSHTQNSKVSIIGGQFVVDIQNALLTTASIAPATPGHDSVLLNAGSTMFTGISSTGHGPDLQIVTDNIQVTGTLPLPPAPPTPVFITTTSFGSGTAGNLSLTASENMNLSTASVASNVFGGASGLAGNVALTSAQGNISLTNQTLVSTQGRSGTLTLNAPHGDILLDMSQANTQVQVPGVLGVNGGGIQVTANNLTLSNSQNLVPSSIEGDNFANPQVPGPITVTLSGNLSMSGGSVIQTVSRGPAAGAADINITAHDVSITGTGMNFGNPLVFNSRINTESQNAGHGGQLNIIADNLQLTNGGQLKSGSVVGIVFVQPPPPPPGSLPQPLPPPQIALPTGSGGTINIQGSTGPITSVLIDGAGSGIFTNSQGSGAGGNTNITAQSLTVQNAGAISAQANGSGPGGQINISTDNLQLINGGQLTSGSVRGVIGGNNPLSGQPLPLPSGAGGDINVSASGSVIMTNGASISASSTSQGHTGDIHINAGNQLVMTNSSITTEANHSSGGAIKITTNPNGTVQLTDSTISASVLDGSGGGGSVNIDPQFVILDNSQIIANSVFGPGGNINITTNLLLPDSTSVISASSQFGQQGNIVVQSPISPASGKIVPLSQKPLIATTLLGQRCAALAGGNISSFTVAGRDALPAEPGSWMSSPLAFSIVESQDGITKEARADTTGSESEETAPLISLRKIAPSGFLTQSFAVSSDCTS